MDTQDELQRQQEDQLPRRATHSLWGAADNVERIADGIHWVSTASHGGVVLSPSRVAKIPDAILPFRKDRTYWEEDSDYAVPMLLFCDDFKAWMETGHTAKWKTEFWHAVASLQMFHPEWLYLIAEAGAKLDRENADPVLATDLKRVDDIYDEATARIEAAADAANTLSRAALVQAAEETKHLDNDG